MRSSKRAAFVLAVLSGFAAAQESRPLSPRIFTADPSAGFLIDRDGDGRLDGLSTRAVLRARATGDAVRDAACAAGAAEIAARLGLETSAADAPPRVDPDAAEGLDVPPPAAARLFAAYWPDVPDEAGLATRPAAPRSGKERRFGLDRLFEIGGLLTDADGDLVPDGFDGMLVPSGEAGSIQAATDVAFRIGMETAGLRFPLTSTPSETTPAAVGGPLVLVGSAQPLVEDLKARGLIGPDPEEGVGEILVVQAAFRGHAAVLVRGGGEAGLRRAARAFFEKVPHLTPERLGAPTLADLATEARRLVAGVSIEGQRARVTRELGVLAAETEGGADLVRIHVDALPRAKALERVEGRWASSPGAMALRGGRTEFKLDAREAGPHTIGATDLFDLAPRWEVDRAIERVKEALADAAAGARIEIEVRVSEPPGERATLRSRLRDLVPEASREKAEIVVRSAWKPAYFHVVEELLPRWRDRRVVKVELAARRHEVEGIGGALSTLEAPTRLLQELYPADDVVARALALKVGEDVVLKLLPRASENDYVFTTTDAEGRTEIEGFDVHFHERPFNSVMPEVERVAVWSGLVRVAANGRTLALERVTTDLEELWDAYQTQVLPRIRDLVLQGTDGRPEPRHAPWFGRLYFFGAVSEPDEELPDGLGRTSSVDMLHEELYFHTIGFVQALGGVYSEKFFEFPGIVVPRISAAPGWSPKITVELAGRASHGPKLEALRKRERAAAEEGVAPEIVEERVSLRELRTIDVPDPRVTALKIRADDLLEATIAFRCDVVADDRPARLLQLRPEDADVKVFAVDHGVALVEEAAALRRLGSRREDWFAYPGLALATFQFAAEGVVKTASLELDPSARREKFADAGKAPIAFIPEERPLRPDEAEGVLAGLVETASENGLDGRLRVYAAGTTTLGRTLWALETGVFDSYVEPGVKPPIHHSRRKLAAWKPTLLISAREHANEVSSTTHVLQWLRDVLKDDQDLLRHVRLVVNPVWNADGADLAMDLAEERPNDLLHAGYLGAYGENLTVGQEERDPVYREAKLRLELFAAHLPDVCFNPHGYPMHEWVQPFSGYAAWVKRRAPKTRDWWIPRGAFVQTYQYVDDEALPALKRIADDIKSRVAREMDSEASVRALNADQYERYRRWGRFLPTDLRLPCVHDVAVFGPLRGVEEKKDAAHFNQRSPKTCVANVILEVPDETASGEHLKTVCAAGRAVSRALAQFLRERAAHPETKITHFRDGATRVRARVRTD